MRPSQFLSMLYLHTAVVLMLIIKTVSVNIFHMRGHILFLVNKGKLLETSLPSFQKNKNNVLLIKKWRKSYTKVVFISSCRHISVLRLKHTYMTIVIFKYSQKIFNRFIWYLLYLFLLSSSSAITGALLSSSWWLKIYLVYFISLTNETNLLKFRNFIFLLFL